MCCFTIQYPNNAALCCWNGGSGVPNSAWYCGGVEAGGMEALCCQPVQWKRSLTHQPPLQPIPRSCTYQTRVRSHFCSLFTADMSIRACNGSQHTRSRSPHHRNAHSHAHPHNPIFLLSGCTNWLRPVLKLLSGYSASLLPYLGFRWVLPAEYALPDS